MKTSNQSIALREFVQQAMHDYFLTLDGHPPVDLYNLVVKEVEIPLLQATLNFANGNQTVAAKVLGISRSTLRKKIKQFI